MESEFDEGVLRPSATTTKKIITFQFNQFPFNEGPSWTNYCTQHNCISYLILIFMHVRFNPTSSKCTANGCE